MNDKADPRGDTVTAAETSGWRCRDRPSGSRPHAVAKNTLDLVHSLPSSSEQKTCPNPIGMQSWRPSPAESSVEMKHP